MKKAKISIIQVSRLMIQIIFFVLLPSLYISTFVGIKQIYLALIGRGTSLSQLIPQLIEVIAIVPFTIILGRYFCGWMCAFGAFGDFVYGVSNKLFKIKFRVDETLDRYLKYIKYVVLAFLIFVVCTFSITAFSTFSPWDAFGVLATVGKLPDFSYAVTNLTAGLLLFILITIASMFIERFFCRYLCPLGAVFAITSKLRITKIKKERSKCGKCRICTNNCAMGIPLYKTDVVDSGECINCMKCVTACPRKNVMLTVSEKDVRPLAAGVAVVSVMTGMYYAGNLGVKAAGISTQTEAQGSTVSSKNLYKDGTYKGSGTGFRGGTTTVSVVVRGGKITDITTVSSEDTERFYEGAFSTISEEIIKNQSTDVDAVSGATYSSNGIMQAVEDALKSAKISTGSTSTASSSAAASTNEEDTTSTVSNSSQYKDGTYEGSGIGFRGGTTTVAVVVKGGKITDITTVSSEDTERFYEGAFSTVSEEIIKNQSTDVDAVSGATYSSRGIMEAVSNALGKGLIQ